MQQWKIGMEIFLYLIYFIPWLLFHYSMQQKNQQLTIAVIMITMDSTKRNEISKGGCQEIIRNRVTSKGSGRRSSWYLMIRIWYLIEFYSILLPRVRGHGYAVPVGTAMNIFERQRTKVEHQNTAWRNGHYTYCTEWHDVIVPWSYILLGSLIRPSLLFFFAVV